MAKNIRLSQLTRNIGYNFLGSIAPMGIALLAVPILIKGIGTERFGTLTIMWMIVGYFSIFDLGIGRAVTKYVAQFIEQDRNDELPSLIWTGWIIVFSFGLLGGMLFYLSVPLIVGKWLHFQNIDLNEVKQAFNWMALSIPFIISQLGFMGVLEAQNRFDLSNYVSVPNRLLNYLLPLAILPFTKRLDFMALSLAINQVLISIWAFILCMNSLPLLQSKWLHFNKNYFLPLLRFGGWLTVSSIVSPAMEDMDRFLIGTNLSLSYVAYYTTPYEALSKVNFIPNALSRVFYPIFSGLAAVNSENGIKILYRSIKLIVLTMTPLLFVIVIFGYDVLFLWVGKEFADQGVQILKLFALGFLYINALGRLFTNWVHANGRPDITAKFHLFELPIYIILLLVLLKYFGIVGAAVAWVLRVTLDTMLLFVASFRYTKSRFIWTSSALTIALGFSFFIIAWFLSSLSLGWINEFVVTSTILILYTFLAWKMFLDQIDREFITKNLKLLITKFVKVLFLKPTN